MPKGIRLSWAEREQQVLDQLALVREQRASAEALARLVGDRKVTAELVGTDGRIWVPVSNKVAVILVEEYGADVVIQSETSAALRFGGAMPLPGEGHESD